MLKVGILTTFFSKNYGAVLQAYATEKIIEKLGHTAEFINYQKTSEEFYIPISTLKEQEKLSLVGKIEQKVRNFFAKLNNNQKLSVGSLIRNKEFDVFVKDFLKIGKTSYTSPKEFISDVPHMPYDVYLCGSDQIWNPIVHNFDDVYYLNFPTTAKKVSYASSVAYIVLRKVKL